MSPQNSISIELRIRASGATEGAVQRLKDNAINVLNVLRRSNHETIAVQINQMVDDELKISLSEVELRGALNIIHSELKESVLSLEILVVIRSSWDRADITISKSLIRICHEIGADIRIYRYT